MMYLYEDHLYGELYISDKYLSAEERYCEICEDSDTLLGEFINKEDAVKIAISNGYEKDYAEEIIGVLLKEREE